MRVLEKLVAIGRGQPRRVEMATSKLKAAESDVANLRQRLLLLGLSSQRVSALRSTSQVSFGSELTGACLRYRDQSQRQFR